MRHKKIPTSAEVWAVIRAKHHEDLSVFSTISNPDGDPNGRSDQGRMMTEYGLKGADVPLLGADTTWDIPEEEPKYKRLNETTKYWLCIPYDD